jgi:hypothetical protein
VLGSMLEENAVSRWRVSGTFASRCVLGAVAAAVITAAPAAAEPWGFEQVSPQNKAEGTVATVVRGFRTSPDGNVFLNSARQPFASVPTEASPFLVRYEAIRGDDGWHNRPLDPPMSPRGEYYYGVLQSSQDTSHVLVGSDRALTPGATEGGGNLYVRNTRTGAYTLVATSPDRQFIALYSSTTQGPTGVTFVANDGRSALFVAATALPGDPVAAGVIYRWTATGGLEAVSILPADEGGGRVTAQTLGAPVAGPRDPLPVDDGHALDRIYFGAVDPESGLPAGLYVREGGETRLISKSQLPGATDDPVPALPDAAGTGGRYVTFHTVGNTPLTADTPVDEGWDATYIYRYDATNGGLQYVGTGSGYAYPVLQMSPDGKVIAFTGASALTPDAVDGHNIGRMNLYVWRDDGTASGALRLVETTDPYSTASVNDQFLRRLSPNGRYFAYTDTSTSVAARFGLDNVSPSCPAPYTLGPASTCDQVYLYDTVTDQLACVSCRADGQLPRGHAGNPYTLDPSNNGWNEVDHYQPRTVTDDGTVFFTTADELLPAQDANQLNDVYAYRDGTLRLVSRGTPQRSSRFLDATPDGKTVFFATDDPIVATDTDEELDVYMTRAGAGFAYTPPTVPPPCSGSDCRDQGAAALSQPVAATVTFNGRGDLSAPLAKVSVAKVKAVKGSVATLLVKVASKGRLRASGSGLTGVTRSAAKAGSYRMRVGLTATAKKTLARGRSVTKRVTVTFTPSGGQASSATVSLTFKPAKTIKKGRQS